MLGFKVQVLVSVQEYSSVAEHSFHTRTVGGSNPPTPTIDNYYKREYTNNMIDTDTEETVVTERQLKIADRCDSCGAQAFVLVKGISGELMFCGHHYTKNEAGLIKFAYEIVDERQHINQHSASSPI